MKNLIYLFVVAIMFAFTACGGGVCADDCAKACCATEVLEVKDAVKLLDSMATIVAEEAVVDTTGRNVGLPASR